MVAQQTAPRTDTAIDEAALADFTGMVRGATIRPGDAGYDAARAVRNGLIDRRPALIVRCSGVADVVDAVNFARDTGLLLSVRGGGHNVAGNAVNDGGMVIDLSAMRAVHVDPTRARPAPRAARPGAISIGRRSSSGSPRRAASFPAPASAD